MSELSIGFVLYSSRIECESCLKRDDVRVKAYLGKARRNMQE